MEYKKNMDNGFGFSYYIYILYIALLVLFSDGRKDKKENCVFVFYEKIMCNVRTFTMGGI